MRFIHGAFTAPGDQNFWLWAEAPSDAAVSLDSLEFYPYALTAEDLGNLLREAFGIRKSEVGGIEGWFPYCNGMPIPSTPLVAEALKTHRNGTKLVSRVVAGAAIPYGIALDLLSALKNPALQPGIFCAPDLIYWSETARFALHLVITQKYIPSLQEATPLWRPVLLGEDRRRFDQLCRAMPGSARAFSDGDARAPGSRDLLWQFLERAINSVIEETCVSALPQKSKTIQDHWLSALAAGSMQPALAKFPDQAQAEFRENLLHWTTPLLRRTSFDYRLAFRLEEPTPKKDFWYVRYFLQNESDPSLLIPLSKVWKYTRTAREIFGAQYELAMQNALVSLAQAGKLDPFVETSLLQPQPSGYEIDAEEAWRFLNARAWILQDSGFGILLPSWWGRQRANLRLGLKARVKSTTKQSFAASEGNPLIDFDWKIAIGSEEIRYEELMALARLKTPLVKFRGKWVELRPEEIQAAINFWKAQQPQQASLSDLLRLMTGVEENVAGLPVASVEASGWLAEFLHDFKEHASYKFIDPPSTFCGVLRDYQHRGFSWLHFMKSFRLGACLADDMGLGKTIQTIALLLADVSDVNRRPVLLICPTSVVGNWQRELARFAPSLRVMIHHGVSRKKGEEFQNAIREFDVVLSSYSLLMRDVETLQAISWRGVVLDEAQNIKNAETKQARAARALQAHYRIALTGTPVENNIGELWSIFEFLNPGLLGTKTEFKERYFNPIHNSNDAEAAEQLRRTTGPFLLRRLKTDPEIVRELPKKLEMKVFCNLTREQASLYAAAVRALEEDLKDKELEGIERKGKILGAVMRLKQICNHPVHFLRDGSPLEGRSGKLARLTEMLEEAIESEDRILIFTQFVEMGHLLKAHLQNYFGREAAFLHGGVPRGQREKMVDRFNHDPDGPPVFLLSLKAGGTGLNLTRANHVFHFDRWWNPAVEEQATDRAYRIGQTKNVQVRKMICIGTLEERIDEMIEKKKAISGAVISAGESWLTELSTEEIKSLIALGKEAVSV